MNQPKTKTDLSAAMWLAIGTRDSVRELSDCLRHTSPLIADDLDDYIENIDRVAEIIKENLPESEGE